MLRFFKHITVPHRSLIRTKNRKICFIIMSLSAIEFKKWTFYITLRRNSLTCWTSFCSNFSFKTAKFLYHMRSNFNFNAFRLIFLFPFPISYFLKMIYTGIFKIFGNMVQQKLCLAPFSSVHKKCSQQSNSEHLSTHVPYFVKCFHVPFPKGLKFCYKTEKF